jgi:putative DNA methylase
VIPKDCKRLAEVDFPIAEVSRHAAREKSIRHGHPSTLHLWWARRPLASSRAVLLALLYPDPCDPLCPTEFKEQARKLLPQVGGCNPGTTDEDLRKALLKFIGDFANWDNASQRTYLEVSRALVKAAHGEEPPLVVDPFAGGGSIPLEALRLGCEAFASDLNPVACLILKVMLEDIPRHGPKLAEELRSAGAEIKRHAEKELGDLYPKDPDGGTPIAYLWARTVRCESPNCGAEIPLVRSLWLCKKASRRRALKHRVVHSKGEVPRVEFEVFEPEAEADVPAGTVTRAKATCLACGAVLAPQRVRAQLVVQRGGANVILDRQGRRTGGALLLAIITSVPGEAGRRYRVADMRDYGPISVATKRLESICSKKAAARGLTAVPDEAVVQTRVAKNSPFRFHLYGFESFGSVSTIRQQLYLATLAQLVRASQSSSSSRDCLSILVSRIANASTSLCRWHNSGEKLEGMFSRQAVSMVWDFCEGAPFSGATGGLTGAFDWVLAVVDNIAGLSLKPGQALQVDAAESVLSDLTAQVWFTDPPYYDAVSYADLSDFFFAWLKRTAQDPSRLQDADDAGNPLTPKAKEIIQDDSKTVDGRPKDRAFFEESMGKTFVEGRRVLCEEGIGSVVFAHKTTEGWEALLSGMIRGGWTITGSWPLATEMGARLRARDSAALATSVHLVCRPRLEHAPVGDWAVVLGELPNRVGDWMERLQGEGVRGADLLFACIGPALEIFSRYTKVETADGREVALAEYLEKVWEVVGRSALAQVLGTSEAKARNGAAGAVEEDARLTALFLWTLQSTDGETADDANDEGEDEEPSDEDDDEEGFSRGKAKGFTLVFDVVRRFAQPLGIELPKWEGRVIETKKGVVRLLPIAERAKQLFGEDGAQAVAARLEQEATTTDPLQGILFPEVQPRVAPTIRGRGPSRGKRAGVEVSDESMAAAREATTLDRVHAAMLLQAGGRPSALRALLKAEQERGPDFLRLANALSALYPKGSEEKRLLDAMLLAVPR